MRGNRLVYAGFALLSCGIAGYAFSAMSAGPGTVPSLLELPTAHPVPALTPAVQNNTAIAPQPVTSVPAAPSATPPSATDTSGTDKAMQDISAKNPDILITPAHLGTLSLMFSASDTELILQALQVYDNSAEQQKTEHTGNTDSLTALLDSLKSQKNTPAASTDAAAPPPPLPNLYLGSIIYYSPSHWSVWVNDNKLVNRHNAPGNEFYVNRLSRVEVELVWKPKFLLDTPEIWRQLTDGGAHPLPHVAVDVKQGTITVQMRPNQTFIPKTLAIREGFIKSAPVPAVAPGAPGDTNPAGSAMPTPDNAPLASSPFKPNKRVRP